MRQLEKAEKQVEKQAEKQAEELGGGMRVTKDLPVYVTGTRGSPRLSRTERELIAILAISQRWLGSHISDPHFHMRTRGTHAYHAFPAARATRTPSPAYACGGCHQRVSS